MKTMYSITSKEKAISCPRQAFIQGEIPGGAKKYRCLRSIFMQVMNNLPQNCSSTDVENQIDAEFTIADLGEMLSFEVESEKKKMKDLVNRYIYWEAAQGKSEILAKDFTSVIQFNNEDVEVKVHRLFDRGGYYEGVLYAYKRPDIKRNGRSMSSRMDASVRMLMVDMATRKKIEQLQRVHGQTKIPNKAIYGSVFFMRSGHDSKEFLPFNEKDDQVLTHSFSPAEKNDIEAAYKNIDPNANKVACKDSECQKCTCIDLCKCEFVPKKKVELPPPEIKPINEIRLTPQQEKFVNFRSGECRVNAVAGSGKTTIVTLRTIALMEDGTKPGEILMLTFTEKACGEMRERLERYTKGSSLSYLNLNLDELTIATFNGWGQSILAKNFDKLGFKEEPQVIDDITKKDIIIDLLENHRNLPLNYNEPFMDNINAMGAVIEVSKLLDSMKAAHVETVQDVLRIPKLTSSLQRCSAELLEIYQEYNKKLVELNKIDFEDQLRLILKLKQFGVFKAFPYKHIVVDEFQDSNPNQIDLIRQIMNDNPGIQSLAVVGDVMQAIYGFRDASPENLLTFKQFFPNMKDFQLEENFRSQQPIIQVANNILAQESKLKSVIKAHRNSSQVAPLLINKDDPKDELAFIVSQCKDWIENNHMKPSSIAILGHTRSELRNYEKALNEAGLPTIMRVPEILRDDPFVKVVLAFAKWLDDPTQMICFALYAKLMGQDPFDIKALKQSAEVVRQTFDNAPDEETRRGLFFQYLNKVREDYMGEYFMKELEEQSSIHTFKDLVTYCVKYDRYCIAQPYSTVKEASEAITLITIHSAKGLEYDNVMFSMKKFKEMDEEKRLLYVAVTRARERLVITYPSKQGLVRLLRDDTKKP